MHILITGGFGFVGGRLGQYLHQAGHQITLGSRSLSNPPNWFSCAKVVKTDWNDTNALEQACVGMDIVIQAAGLNAQDCTNDPVAALEINGLATARLVESAARADVFRRPAASESNSLANCVRAMEDFLVAARWDGCRHRRDFPYLFLGPHGR